MISTFEFSSLLRYLLPGFLELTIQQVALLLQSRQVSRLGCLWGLFVLPPAPFPLLCNIPSLFFPVGLPRFSSIRWHSPIVRRVIPGDSFLLSSGLWSVHLLLLVSCGLLLRALPGSRVCMMIYIPCFSPPLLLPHVSCRHLTSCIVKIRMVPLI